MPSRARARRKEEKSERERERLCIEKKKGGDGEWKAGPIDEWKNARSRRRRRAKLWSQLPSARCLDKQEARETKERRKR